MVTLGLGSINAQKTLPLRLIITCFSVETEDSTKFFQSASQASANCMSLQIDIHAVTEKLI